MAAFRAKQPPARRWGWGLGLGPREGEEDSHSTPPRPSAEQEPVTGPTTLFYFKGTEGTVLGRRNAGDCPINGRLQSHPHTWAGPTQQPHLEPPRPAITVAPKVWQGLARETWAGPLTLKWDCPAPRHGWAWVNQRCGSSWCISASWPSQGSYQLEPPLPPGTREKEAAAPAQPATQLSLTTPQLVSPKGRHPQLHGRRKSQTELFSWQSLRNSIKSCPTECVLGSKPKRTGRPRQAPLDPHPP